MSKRKLLQLVEEVWSAAGMIPDAHPLRPAPAAIPRGDSGFLRPYRVPGGTAWWTWPCWNTVAEDLNKKSPRVMAVLRPLKVVLTNYRKTG